jgi:hypothetical protein
MAHKSDPSKIDASKIPATSRPGSRNQLRKIEGRITDKIYTWLWARTKRIKMNPMKPWKKKTVMEYGQNNTNMRYTFVRLIDMVNLMIAEIAKIPPLEAKVEALEVKLEEEMEAMREELQEHASLMASGTYGPAGHTKNTGAAAPPAGGDDTGGG